MKNALVIIVVLVALGIGYLFFRELSLGTSDSVSFSEEYCIGAEAYNEYGWLSERGKLFGYYEKYSYEGYESSAGDEFDIPAGTCDTFVIIGGCSVINDELKETIESGNIINHLDKNGNVVVNLRFQDLESSRPAMDWEVAIKDQEILLDSDEKKILEADVNIHPPGGGAGLCHPTIRINSLEKYTK